MTPEEVKALKEAREKEVADLKAEIKEAQEESKKELNEKLDTATKELGEIKEKLEAIEKLPFNGKAPAVGGQFSSKIKIGGYNINLDNQGTTAGGLGTSSLHEAIENCKSKSSFKAFNKEEKVYDYKKFMMHKLLSTAFPQNPDVQVAYQKYMAERKANDMVEGTPSLGGYGVPTEYENDFILLAKDLSFALQECNTSITMNTDNKKIPAELTGFTAGIVGENTAATASNATQREVDLVAKKLMVLTSSLSNELIADTTTFDLLGYVESDSRYQIAQLIDNTVLNDAGTATANGGILTSAVSTNSVTMSAGNTSFADITDTDLSLMMSQVSVGDRVNGKFIYSSYIEHLIRTLKDSNGAPIFIPSSNPTIPSTVWGKPYIVSEKAPLSSDDAANKIFAAFGDFKKFAVAPRMGSMNIEADPYNAFAEYSTRFRIVTRFAFEFLRESAFCILKSAAA